MNHLFKTFSSSQFAVLTVAAVVASASGTLYFGAPVVQSLVQSTPMRQSVARVGGTSIARPFAQEGGSSIVTSLRSQVSALASRVVSLESNQRRDMVLGENDAMELAGTGDSAIASSTVNVVRNSSFEEASDSAPRQWNYQLDSTSGNTKTSAEAIRTGSQGLKFTGGGTGNYGISQPGAKTIERRAYVLSMWVKPVNTDSHTIKLSFWDEVNNKEARAKTFTLSGTKEWSRIVFPVDNRNTWSGKKWFPMILVNGLGSGTLYIDDVQLEEANEYTLYHFDGGGSVQAHVSILGDGSVEVDAHGNIYPAVSGIGALGTGSNKFEQLVLSKASINKDGTASFDGDMTVNGNSTLKGTVSFTGRFGNHLLPDINNTYDLGSTTYKWRDIYIDGLGYIDGISLVNAETIGNGTDGDIILTDSGTSNALTFDLNNASDTIAISNTEDLDIGSSADGADAMRVYSTAGGIDIEATGAAAGEDIDIAATGSSVNLTSTESVSDSVTLRSANGGIDISSAANGVGNLTLRAGGTLQLDTSATNAGMNFNTGTGTLTQTIGALSTTAQNDAVNAIALNASRGGIQLSTSNASSNGVLYLKSAGTLVLDTTSIGTDINILSGNSTSTALTLRSTRGGIDLSSSNASGAGNLTLRSGGTLTLDTSALGTNVVTRTGTGRFDLLSASTAVNAITLNASTGGIDISTGTNAGLGAANIVLRGGGTMTLDTTANNTNIEILAGGDTSTSLILRSDRGGIDLSSSAATGAGDIRIKSGGTLQLDTSLGNGTILVRTGTGTVDISTGLELIRAQNDNVGAIRLLADRGGIEISSGSAGGNGNVTIKSGGTLRLDTSTTNANIMVRAGTGRIDLSGNTILINSGAGTMDLSSNGAINIVSSTTAQMWGEAGTTIGRAGTVTTAMGRLCVRGSDGGTACPAGDNGRLFVQVTGEATDDPGDVFDVAEYYPASEVVEPGTVVVADAGARATVKMSRYPYQKVLGVVSTTPALRINEGSFSVGSGAVETGTRPLVALVGRVPVKVTNENGAIRVGDRLVASSTVGYAMKATKQGLTLGMALEDIDFDGGTTEGKVMTFVNVSWYFPEVMAAIEQEHQVATALGTTPNTDNVLALAAASMEPASATTTNSQAVTGAVLGATDASAVTELVVAVAPTEFPNINVIGTLNVGKDLAVAGKSTFQGVVTVMADATFQQSVVVLGNVRIGGDLEVAGAVVTSLTADTALAAGDPVSVNGNGAAVRASGGRAVVGIAASNAAAGEIVKIAVAGKVNGLSGLTAGSRYFVNDAGVLSTDGAGAQAVGVALSATSLLVQPGVGLPGVAASVSVPVEETPAPVVEQPAVSSQPEAATPTPTTVSTEAPEVTPTPGPTVTPEQELTPTPEVTVSVSTE